MKKKVRAAKKRLWLLSGTYVGLFVVEELFRLSHKNWANWGWTVLLFFVVLILFMKFADGDLNHKIYMSYYIGFSALALYIAIDSSAKILVQHYLQIGMLSVVVIMRILGIVDSSTREYLELRKNHWEKYKRINSAAIEKLKEEKHQQSSAGNER